MQTIDSIIFDLGRVLINWYPYQYMVQVFGEEIASALHESIFSVKETALLDRGEMSEDEIWQIRLKRYPEYAPYIEHMKDKILDLLTPIEENVNLIPELKRKGYKLYVLSNFSKQAFDAIYSKYGFFTYFDGLVISSHHHTVKPEKKIYEVLIQEHGVAPETSVFIDDREENIATAKKLGFHVIHLEQPSLLKQKLEVMNVL